MIFRRSPSLLLKGIRDWVVRVIFRKKPGYAGPDWERIPYDFKTDYFK